MNSHNTKESLQNVHSKEDLATFDVQYKHFISTNKRDLDQNNPLKKSLYLDQDQFIQYLNSTFNSVVDFGIGAGLEMQKLAEKGWAITGYDLCENMYSPLSELGYKMHIVDFNQIDDSKETPYESLVANDLAQATNIVSIHTLQYISTLGIMKLIAALLHHAKTGSIFFLVNHTGACLDGKTFMQPSPHKPRNQFGCLPKNYIPSFFAPRVDIEFLLLYNNIFKKTVTSGEDIELHNEVLVMKKL